MSGEKILKGFKSGGLPGAIRGIEANDVKKAAEKAVVIGDAASRGGKMAIAAAKKAKAGIDQYRVERAQRAAKVKTEEAQHKIRSYESILKTRVEEDCKRDWATLLEDVFSGSPPPSLKEAKVAAGVPRRNPINAVRKGERDIRSAKEAEARELHQKLVREYDETVSQAKLELARLKARYEKGDADAIEFYVRGVLRRSAYPEGVQPELDVSLDPSEKTVVVDFVVPSISYLPAVSGYKYDESVNKEVEVLMSQTELDELYEDVLYQLCLKSLYIALSSSPASQVECAVFNGWVPGVDRRNGRDAYSCVLSCMARREEFLSFKLSEVTGRDCFRHLKGVGDEPLARLAPIAPIMRPNKRDPRFMEPMEM